MQLSLRRLAALAEIAATRRRDELGDALLVIATGAQGDKKGIDKLLEDLRRGR